MVWPHTDYICISVSCIEIYIGVACRSEKVFVTLIEIEL